MQLSSGYLRVVIAMLIWGSVGIFVRWANQPAPTIVFFRVSTAFIALSIYLLWRRQPLQAQGHWRAALLSGIVLAFNWLFFFKSIQLTTIGNAVLSYYMSPLFSIVWARLFLHERLERQASYALLLATLGIGLVVSSYEFSLSNQDFLGIMFGLTGALFYSMVVILVKHLAAIDSSQLVLIQTGVATLVFLPLIIATPPVLTPMSLLSMLTMGVVHSALALGIYFSGLKTIKVQYASILSYIDPVSSLLFAYLVFGEIPTLYTMLGGTCILAASYLVMKTK